MKTIGRFIGCLLVALVLSGCSLMDCSFVMEQEGSGFMSSPGFCHIEKAEE